MPVKTQAELRSELDATIFANPGGEITPATVHALLLDMIDSAGTGGTNFAFGTGAATGSGSASASALALFRASGAAAGSGTATAAAGSSTAFQTDFLALSALPTGVSLSRATTGTYFDASGVLQTAAIDAPRFDHAWNGSAWVPTGLLIEEQRTNLVLHSSDLSNAAWTKQAGSISTDGTLASDGVTQYGLFTSTGGNSEFYQNITGLTIGSDATLFFEAKAGAGNFIFVSYEDVGGPWFAAVFDVSQTTDQSPTQTAFGTSGGSASAKYLGNGRFRVSLTKSSLATTAGYFVAGIANAATGITFSGGDISGPNSSGKSAYFSFCQVEVGTFPTSYIPTTTAAVTRSADIAQLTGAARAAALATTASIIAEVSDRPDTTEATRIVGSSNQATALEVSAGKLTLYNLTVAVSSSVLTWPDTHRGAVSYDSSGISLSADGGAVVTSSDTHSSGMSDVILGSDGAANFLNGHFRSLAIYSIRLSDADIQTKSVVGATF